MSRDIIKVLDDFIQNFYWGQDLTSKQAEENLDHRLVEILQHGQHSSNGLLISDSGYFLTSRHCIEPMPVNGRIRLYDGSEYPIERSLAVSNESLDLAIVKADVSGNDEARVYKFYPSQKIENNTPVALHTRWNGEFGNKFGFTQRNNSKDYLIRFQMDAQKGDSGGIITSSGSVIMGLLRGKALRHLVVLHSNAVSIFKALELIDFYKRRLESRL